MYRINDNSAAVKEVQGYLYQLHRAEPQKYRRVYIDGVYGKETEMAVLEFQELHSLEKTGAVDYETFTALSREHSILSLKENVAPIRIGDSGSKVEYLNLLLYDLSAYYVDMPPPRRSRYFSEETNESVEYIKKVFLMPTGGGVDRAFIDRLESELSSRRRISL